jgi:tRNA pseudouridine55 synthase
VKSQALESETELAVPLYRFEGLFAVNKPLEWTSQDVVSYIRGILERDARNRGAKPAKLTDRRNKNRAVRVGHGGTLDPLATGVLVIGVGKGTKELQR